MRREWTEEELRMIEKGFAEAHSNLETPIFGQLITPLCKSCVHFIKRRRLEHKEPQCQVFGEIPEKYIEARAWDCPHYERIPDCPKYLLPTGPEEDEEKK